MKQKRLKKRYIFLILLVILAIAAFIFMHFGGFSTGDNIDPTELTKYAQNVEDIKIPDGVRIVALGEATHGNAEFQKLKLDVFKQMVEKYGVKAFAIEGDFGGCEKVNEYIQGGEGNPREVAKSIGFLIYRTDEIEKIISYMREYNEKVTGENLKLRFYGFDMQRYVYNFEYLIDNCKKLDIDVKDVQKLINKEEWNEEYDNKARIKILTEVKNKLVSKKNSEKAVHFADILLQYCELQNLITTNNMDKGSFTRDKFMAENVQWILEQEEKLGNKCIFINGHNTHVAKYPSMDTMGKLISKQMGNNYYVIGTDFYKTSCNLPVGPKERTIQTFYSHDPIAKTVKMAGLDSCWIDFSNVPQNSELYKLISKYIYMGNLGEGYSLIMRILPPSYRDFQTPSALYDSMIFITNATPTNIHLD